MPNKLKQATIQGELYKHIFKAQNSLQTTVRSILKKKKKN